MFGQDIVPRWPPSECKTSFSAVIHKLRGYLHGKHSKHQVNASPYMHASNCERRSQLLSQAVHVG